jgi:hypothetical protein
MSKKQSKKQSKTISKPASKKASKSAQAAQQAAHAEPVTVVTTAAPAAERPAAAVTVPAAAKPAKAPKAPKVPREERNGVKRPKADGACGKVWAHLDTKGDMSVADVKAWATSEGLNPGNAAIEIYLWRKFNGIKPVKVANAVKPGAETKQAT